MASIAWKTLPYEGDLEGTPVRLVAPGDMHDFDDVAKMIGDEAGARQTLDESRLHRFYMRSRERYLELSSDSERVTAPAGTGHNFLYEAPDFVLQVVEETLARCRARGSVLARPGSDEETTQERSA